MNSHRRDFSGETLVDATDPQSSKYIECISLPPPDGLSGAASSTQEQLSRFSTPRETRHALMKRRARLRRNVKQMHTQRIISLREQKCNEGWEKKFLDLKKAHVIELGEVVEHFEGQLEEDDRKHSMLIRQLKEEQDVEFDNINAQHCELRESDREDQVNIIHRLGKSKQAAEIETEALRRELNKMTEERDILKLANANLLIERQDMEDHENPVETSDGKRGSACKYDDTSLGIWLATHADRFAAFQQSPEDMRLEDTPQKKGKCYCMGMSLDVVKTTQSSGDTELTSTETGEERSSIKATEWYAEFRKLKAELRYRQESIDYLTKQCHFFQIMCNQLQQTPDQAYIAKLRNQVSSLESRLRMSGQNYKNVIRQWDQADQTAKKAEAELEECSQMLEQAKWRAIEYQQAVEHESPGKTAELDNHIVYLKEMLKRANEEVAAHQEWLIGERGAHEVSLSKFNNQIDLTTQSRLRTEAEYMLLQRQTEKIEYHYNCLLEQINSDQPSRNVIDDALAWRHEYTAKEKQELQLKVDCHTRERLEKNQEIVELKATILDLEHTISMNQRQLDEAEEVARQETAGRAFDKETYEIDLECAVNVERNKHSSQSRREMEDSILLAKDNHIVQLKELITLFYIHIYKLTLQLRARGVAMIDGGHERITQQAIEYGVADRDSLIRLFESAEFMQQLGEIEFLNKDGDEIHQGAESGDSAYASRELQHGQDAGDVGVETQQVGDSEGEQPIKPLFEINPSSALVPFPVDLTNSQPLDEDPSSDQPPSNRVHFSPSGISRHDWQYATKEISQIFLPTSEGQISLFPSPATIATTVENNDHTNEEKVPPQEGPAPEIPSEHRPSPLPAEIQIKEEDGGGEIASTVQASQVDRKSKKTKKKRGKGRKGAKK